MSAIPWDVVNLMIPLRVISFFLSQFSLISEFNFRNISDISRSRNGSHIGC